LEYIGKSNKMSRSDNTLLTLGEAKRNLRIGKQIHLYLMSRSDNTLLTVGEANRNLRHRYLSTLI